MVAPRTYGRMGNFLFQAAMAAGYSKKHGLEFTLPTTTTSEKWNPLYLQHLVNPNYNPYLQQVHVPEREHPFHDVPFSEAWRNMNIVLDGYWQCKRYWEEYEKEILDLFAYPWTPNDQISVHVRRTDFIELAQKHPEVTAEWYSKAMEMFPGAKFLFHSDDIQWCKDNFGHREDCSFSEGRNEVEDMISMSCCAHQICSASTYALWGYFLNRSVDKKAIFPKTWFVEGWSNCDPRDIVPSECLKL